MKKIAYTRVADDPKSELIVYNMVKGRPKMRSAALLHTYSISCFGHGDHSFYIERDLKPKTTYELYELDIQRTVIVPRRLWRVAAGFLYTDAQGLHFLPLTGAQSALVAGICALLKQQLASPDAVQHLLRTGMLGLSCLPNQIEAALTEPPGPYQSRMDQAAQDAQKLRATRGTP